MILKSGTRRNEDLKTVYGFILSYIIIQEKKEIRNYIISQFQRCCSRAVSRFKPNKCLYHVKFEYIFHSPFFGVCFVIIFCPLIGSHRNELVDGIEKADSSFVVRDCDGRTLINLRKSILL